MTRKKKIFNLLKKRRDDLLNIGVKSIGVFGSVVRGDDTYSSDYDILVDFYDGQSTYKNFNKLCDLIEATIGNKYDLVTKNGLSPYIAEKILNEVQYVSLI